MAETLAAPLDRPARLAGWLLLAAAAAAAFLALVNPAGLSQTTAYADDGRVRLEYSRLDRAASPTRLRLWIGPGLSSGGRLRVRMSSAYARTMRVTRVHPQPVRVEAGLEDVVFVFAQRSARDAALVEFDLQPADLGRYAGRVAVADGRSVEFTQYMVP